MEITVGSQVLGKTEKFNMFLKYSIFVLRVDKIAK